MNDKATNKFERERYLQEKHAETKGKSYYANVHMFSNTKPLTDSEGKNAHPRICKGDELKEKTFSMEDIETALTGAVNEEQKKTVMCKLRKM